MWSGLPDTSRGQTNTDNPAEYGYIRNRIVPLGMKRISIWTIRYSFDTLRNRSIENPVPFYPLRNTYKNYPFQTDNQTDNKLPRRAKSLKDDMAKKTLSKPKFSLRKCSLWESMSSNDPWLNPFLDPVENRRCLTFNIISIKNRFLSKTILDNSFRLSYIDNLDSYLSICKRSLIDNLITIVVGNKRNQNLPAKARKFP